MEDILDISGTTFQTNPAVANTAASRNRPLKLNRNSRPILAVRYPVIIPRILPDDNCWKSIGARARLTDKSA